MSMKFARASLSIACGLLAATNCHAFSAPLPAATSTRQQLQPTSPSAAWHRRETASSLSSSTPTATSSEEKSSRSATTSNDDDGGGASSLEEGKSLTQRMMESTSTAGEQIGGAGGASTWAAFLRAEANWKRLRESDEFDYDPDRIAQRRDSPPLAPFVTDDGGAGSPACWAKLRSQSSSDDAKLDYDVVLCGGTLGIFVALSLQLKGHSVCVVEAGKLKGREQEWNISMKELEDLVELGVLTDADLEEAIVTEFPGCRSGFKNEEGEF